MEARWQGPPPSAGSKVPGDRNMDIVADAGIVTDVSDAVAAILVTGGGIGISPTYWRRPMSSEATLSRSCMTTPLTVTRSPLCGRRVAGETQT